VCKAFFVSLKTAIMRWKGGRQSDHFEDRRGMSSGGKLALGGVGGVVVLIIGLLLGGGRQQVLEQLQTGTQTAEGPVEISAEEQELADFVKVVQVSTEDVWQAIFLKEGPSFRPYTLVVYRDQTPTDGCGMGASAYGPFYCPADEKVYIDLSFSEELHNRFGATGEFAMAYVLAHEVGHHIQKLTGAMDKVNAARQRLSEREYNKLQVMLELQ